MAGEAKRWFGLRFGAMSAPLSEQLKEQGVTMPDREASAFQSRAEAIVELHVFDILTDGEVKKARQRLMKQITSAVNGGR